MKKKKLKSKKVEKAWLVCFLAIFALLFVFLKPSLVGFTVKKPINYTIVKHGNLDLYKVELEIKERYGLKPINTSFFFRNNPEKLKVVRLSKKPTKNAYVSYDSRLVNCSNISLAAFELGYFLGLIGIRVDVAFTEPLNNSEVKTCKDAKENLTVIVVKNSNTERIYEKDNCMVIEVENCKGLKAIESFILSLIELGKRKNFISVKNGK